MNFFQKTINHFWHKPEPRELDSYNVTPLQLHKLTVLHEDSYPCGRCNIESVHCFKLHFADRTICVIPQRYVNNFSSKNVKTPKDHQK